MVFVAKNPRDFDFGAENLVKEWHEWMQNFTFYLIATQRHGEWGEIKIATLLNQLGQKGIDIFNTFRMDLDSGNVTYDDVIEAFTRHFELTASSRNILLERRKFHQVCHEMGQPMTKFIAKLEKAADTCDFLNRNEMVRDRFVSQVKDEKLLKILLDEGKDLTLEWAAHLCQQYEARQHQEKSQEKHRDLKLDTLNRKRTGSGGSESDSDEDWKGAVKNTEAARRSGGGKFTKKCTLSPELAVFVGSDQMARHEVVKKVWTYIKEKNLYDPKNTQYAICDDDLMKIMGVKRFRTFGMMKYLKKHFVD